MSVSARSLSRDERVAHLDDLAQLRIRVFADWPYLYDGDPAYERDYLQPYLSSDAAVVVGAFDAGKMVGAATGSPLIDHADDFAAAFEGSGIDQAQVYYCAESVLLPRYRGHGLGHRFFDLREAHARRLGYQACTFCSVIRPEDHTARPDDYRPLDGFWRGRGYAPLEGVVASFSWRDHGEAAESRKQLQFWYRDL